MHYGHHFWGMHMFWWIFWIIILIWIFATPYDLPGQQTKTETPLEILKKRFDKGEITKEEFDKKKEIYRSKLNKKTCKQLPLRLLN